VQHLVVDIDLAQSRVHPLPEFFLDHPDPALGERVTQLANAGALDEFRQLEGRLEDASLGLQVAGFLVPVAGHLDRVLGALEVHQQQRVVGGHVPGLNELGPAHARLELCHPVPHFLLGLLAAVGPRLPLALRRLLLLRIRLLQELPLPPLLVGPKHLPVVPSHRPAQARLLQHRLLLPRAVFF
jgi:hypothetical protein